jgi:uncharacterized membrane protein YphA (DoxX/SURF4 family)
VSKNVRQIGILGCFLLVLLRVAIGWQFLYEGIWKLDTQKTAKPWSAEGYLANARGPFRSHFRGMIDDPDGLDKLNYDKMVARWDEWRNKFVAKYPDQEKALAELLDGPALFYSDKLDTLPPGVTDDKFKSLKLPKGTFVQYNRETKQLEANTHLLPADRDALLAFAGAAPENDSAEASEESETADQPQKSDDPVVKKWQAAVKKLYARAGKLSFKERLQVLLKEDPDRVGVVHEAHEGTIDHHRPGKLDVYKHLLERYDSNLKRARQSFHQEHLDKQWREIYDKKIELVGPVDALTSEYHLAAYKLLDAQGLTRGPVPEANTQVRRINQMTMWTLTILGVLLMTGTFSRLAALGAAGLLLMFYLPMPPWPGVVEAPGPEHSLIINKNLIEFFACLALVMIPTGRWIGVDALLRRFVFRKKSD